MKMYAHYKKNQGGLLDLKMPLEPIRDAPKLQVLNAKASPTLSSLISAPRLSSDGKNIMQKRKLTEHKGSVMTLSTDDFIGESSPPFQAFPYTGKEIIGTTSSVLKMHPESHLQNSKYQVSPLALKKLTRRQKLEPIGKIKLEINKVSEVENSSQQKLISGDEYDHSIGQRETNNTVTMKVSKNSVEKNSTVEKCYELRNEQKIQHENLKNDWENELIQEEMQYSQGYIEIFKNEQIETAETLSKINIHELSETLSQTQELSSEREQAIKNLEYENNGDTDRHEELSKKTVHFKSELSLLTELVIDKQQACNVLESEVHTLKNEKSELILKKEQLAHDTCEEYENNMKIHEEKDLLLKDIDELQLEADNIENDLDLLRTEKSKLCLELKKLKDEINEKTAELKNKQELVHMESHESFDKKTIKSEKLLNESIIQEVTFSDFGCQVNNNSSLLCDNINDRLLHVLLDKKVGTDVLSSNAFCQVEADFCCEKKKFSEKQISTELLCSDVSCQTQNIHNADQFVQAEPTCSIKSVNTILTKADLPSTMDISVQTHTMTESRTLDAATQTMPEVQNYALDMKYTINSRNTLDAITRAKLELESKMTPLYQCLQFIEEAVYFKFKKNINEEIAVGDTDAIVSDSAVDLQHLNPAVQITEHFCVCDRKIKSGVGQQNELLSAQGSRATVCSFDNAHFAKPEAFNSVSKETKSRHSPVSGNANHSSAVTIDEIYAVMRDLQIGVQNLGIELVAQISSASENYLKPASSVPCSQNLLATSSKDYLLLGMDSSADSGKSNIFASVTAQSDPKSTVYSKDASPCNMFTLSEAAAILHQQQLQTWSEKMTSASACQNLPHYTFAETSTVHHPVQSPCEVISSSSANHNVSQQYAAFHLGHTPNDNHSYPGVASLLDSARLQFSETDFNCTATLKNSCHSETETLSKAEAFLFQQQAQNHRKEGKSSTWTGRKLSQEYTIVHPSQSVSHAVVDDNFQSRVVSSTDSKKQEIVNSLSAKTELQSSDISEDSSHPTSITLVKIKNLVHEMETDRLRRRLALLNSTSGHLSLVCPSLTQEQNFSGTRNGHFTLSGKFSPTKFQASHSKQNFVPSSHGTCFESFIEEWKANQDHELHELNEIRRRLRQCDRYHF